MKRGKDAKDAESISERMCRNGECTVPPERTRAEVDKQKLAEWQQLYGKRKK